MIRVKVSLPDVDTPFFDGKVTEENYDKFKSFLDELTDRYGKGNLEYSAFVVPDKNKESLKDLFEDKEIPIDNVEDRLAEYIKDHPIVDKELPENAEKVSKDIDKSMEDIIDDAMKEVCSKDDECKLEDITNEPTIELKVEYTLQFLSEIFTARNNKLCIKKENAVTGTYDVVDSLCRDMKVQIPISVMEKCTISNICKFIIQSIVFQLMDEEYYDVDDEHLNECFTDDFDDSYCYDTGILDVTIDTIEPSKTFLKYTNTINKVMEELMGTTLDYREMERLYIQLRKV